MCMVHLSYGINPPASKQLRSETAIVAGIADATLGGGKIDWLSYADDYAKIRDEIAKAVAGFEDFNARVAKPGGFHLTPASRERRWLTPDGKARFIVNALEKDTPIARARALHGDRLMVLMTARSHDQYNTTIYALDDRYRGVYGQRRVLLINRDDIARLASPTASGWTSSPSGTMG
ncbi:putative oxidoreductase [Chromobacterium violaceum]|uniref:Putative oxidoreductase n=1 Tax=Chromobacterium violaceum TaxID=536 RepID=A0A3S4IZB1_CHRVL|nr:putative oxidoreductase [Chromobacterium violaceum]